MTSPVSVVVCGALGKMGRAAVQALLNNSQFKLVGAVARQHLGEDAGHLTGSSSPCGVIIQHHLREVLQQTQAQVCLDLTHPDSVYDNVLAAIACGARPVIGTTGLSQPQLSTLHHTLLQQASGGLYIPNFSIGAVLMMKFAAQAAQYFDHVELVELHHHHKADAPSGTAMMTAQLIAQQQVGKPFNLPQVKEPEHLPGARGAVTDNGIRIHSVRLPGLLAHQEIMFGAAGQLLTLRHDAFDRQCYMPGVLLACQKVLSQMGLVQGLDAIL